MKAMLIRTEKGLRGATEADHVVYGKFKRKLETMQVGSYMRLDWSTPRNGRHHNKFFALLQLITENSETYDTTEKALVAIKLVTGHFDLIQNPITGEIAQSPKSISFEKLPQQEFEVFYSAAINGVLAHILPQLPRDTMDKLLDQILMGWA